MDKRTLLAFVLMALVLVLIPHIFPSRKAPVATAADSARITDSIRAATTSAAATSPAAASTQPGASSGSALPPTAAVAPPSPAPQTTRQPQSLVPIKTPLTRASFANPGAVPVSVQMVGFRDLRPGRRDSLATVEAPSGTLLHYRLALGRDTVALDTVHFTVEQSNGTTTFTSASPAMSISYQATSDDYRLAVRGTVANAPPDAALIIDLPSALRSAEADTTDDLRNMAFGYRIPLREAENIPFTKLDASTVRADTGSLQWVATRNKYWLVAVMKPVGTQQGGIFRGMTMRGGPRSDRIAPVAFATTAIGLPNGQFAFDLYIGPQSWQQLHALGNDLENVNPYAGLLHAVVQPFSTITMRMLLWMRATTRLSYGWVLVIFGVVIRLILWPLNQRAMRTSIQMQRLQPELSEIQKRYKNEPERQREALVKVYQAHNMSPFSPMLGCLPMLLPLPILYALYYVLRNTIELRGVPFLWLPDLSLRDPYYITPIFMGISMYVLSWIGMRATPANPQAKVMSYMMPVMFTFMFLNLASGLNLYYAIQNIAALPQQLMVTRERAKAQVSTGTALGGRKT